MCGMKYVSIDGMLIAYKEKPVWIKRLLMSIVHIMDYNYKALSPGWQIYLVLSTVLLILNSVFRRDYGGVVLLGPYVAGIVFILPHIRGFFVKLYKGRIMIEDDPAILGKITNIKISKEDVAYGFEYVADPYGGPGVVISRALNDKMFLNSEYDILLKIDNKLRRYLIVKSLASRSEIYRPYIMGLFLRSLISRNPLINEEKIGFCNSFWDEKKICEIYKTKYYYSLCSGDMAQSRVCREKGGVRHVIMENKLIGSLNYDDEYCMMRPLNDTVKPISLHGGVDLIGVSKDFFLRVSMQGKHTQFSNELKAPLGSGSMDWGDLRKADNLKSLIKISAVREFLEEWGRRHRIKENIKIDDVLCIGFFRMPHRGGKPQFVVLCKFGNEDIHLRPDPAEVYTQEPEIDVCRFEVKNIGQLQCAVHKILKNEDKRNSVPLLGAMTCLRDAIIMRPALISKVLGYVE
jgi:hypothetical protein